MREPDAKLFGYLTRLPKLGAFIQDYGGLHRRRESVAGRWVIGQGYQPFNEDDRPGVEASAEFRGNSPIKSEHVGRLPDLPIAAFSRLAQGTDGLVPATSSDVRRRGFEAGFDGARVLVPRGVETIQGRRRAAFCNRPLTFQHIVQAITVPDGEHIRAKLLTAFLNSRLAVWYAFHGTASFGSDRPEVAQADLLRLPFPSPLDLPDPIIAEKAAEELVYIVDYTIAEINKPFMLTQDRPDLLSNIDRLVYTYFGLSDEEIVLIDDTVEFIMPALQPHEGYYPVLWQPPDYGQRRAFAETLAASLVEWLRGQESFGPRLIACSADLAVLRLSLGEVSDYVEDENGELIDVLSRLSKHISQPLDGNFQVTPDLRVFVGNNLYLVKPMQLRYWLKSTALADADSIALDLQHFSTPDRPRSVG